MSIYKIGKEEKDEMYFDAELVMANKEFFLEFFHIPTGNSVQFKALLTEFSDKYESQWNGETYYGRMDPTEIFKGTKRTISVAWDIAAASEGEAKDNMSKLSLLVSMLYPVYEDADEPNATSMAAAPLFKLSFANLIKDRSHDSVGSEAATNGLVGRIGGLAVTPDINAGFFDGEVGKLYPKEYKMSFEYTVFHSHRLGWKKGSKKFFVKNFPYGVEYFGGEPSKDTQTDGKDGKTTQQKQAAVNKLTKGKK